MTATPRPISCLPGSPHRPAGPCRARAVTQILQRTLALAFCFALPSAAGAGGDPAYGEYLASECFTCHRAAGEPVAGIPKIAGMPYDAFVAAFMAYKTKARANVTMQTIASRYPEEDIAALGTYFASLKP